MSTHVVWDRKFDTDFLPDEDAVQGQDADGDGQYQLHQLQVFLKHMARHLGFILWHWPISGQPLLDALYAKDHAIFLLVTFLLLPVTCAHFPSCICSTGCKALFFAPTPI